MLIRGKNAQYSGPSKPRCHRRVNKPLAASCRSISCSDEILMDCLCSKVAVSRIADVDETRPQDIVQFMSRIFYSEEGRRLDRLGPWIIGDVCCMFDASHTWIPGRPKSEAISDSEQKYLESKHRTEFVIELFGLQMLAQDAPAISSNT